jgi:hypothetical protein
MQSENAQAQSTPKHKSGGIWNQAIVSLVWGVQTPKAVENDGIKYGMLRLRHPN